MTVPSLVVTEIVLTLAGLGALNQVRRGQLPASLFWAVGIGTITLAAFAGAIRFAGFEPAREPYLLLSRIAGTAGVASLLFAGVFSLIWRPAGTLALLVTAFAVGLLIFAGLGFLPTFGLGLGAVAMIGLVLCALVAMRSRRRAATWTLIAVALAAVAEAARLGFFRALPIGPADLYHLLLAIALVCFGVVARRS